MQNTNQRRAELLYLECRFSEKNVMGQRQEDQVSAHVYTEIGDTRTMTTTVSFCI